MTPETIAKFAKLKERVGTIRRHLDEIEALLDGNSKVEPRGGRIGLRSAIREIFSLPCVCRLRRIQVELILERMSSARKITNYDSWRRMVLAALNKEIEGGWIVREHIMIARMKDMAPHYTSPSVAMFEANTPEDFDLRVRGAINIGRWLGNTGNRGKKEVETGFIDMFVPSHDSLRRLRDAGVISFTEKMDITFPGDGYLPHPSEAVEVVPDLVPDLDDSGPETGQGGPKSHELRAG